MRVLIAEDDRISQRLLERLLEYWGYETLSVSDGESALQLIQQGSPPEIVLLDWMMPKLDGLTVCRRIRSGETVIPPYLILVTARGEAEDIVKGFEAGADDYVTKPFNREELLARIKVGQRMVELEASLAESNQSYADFARRMENLAEDRAKQLVHADRMSTIGILAAGIAHEINNPTTFISGNLQFLEDCWPTVRETLQQNTETEQDDTARHQREFILEEFPKVFQGIRKGTKRIRTIVQGLKTYSRDDYDVYEEVDVNELIEQALELCMNRLKYSVNLEKDISANIPKIYGNLQQFEQVIVNFVLNAVDAIEDQGEGTIRITTEHDSFGVSIWIDDSGPGISKKAKEDLFTPFFTTKEPGKGTGLGLSISKNIVEKYGGSIEVSNSPLGGARFGARFPVVSNKKGAVK
ncbi:MAG: response regulator [Synergistales bacterium]|nr:response regulator [Synergistales bacterium]